MPNFQRTEIIGHVGKDPEVLQSANGLAIAKFSVAVSEKYKDNEHTEWFNVVVWDKLADICAQYLSKGKLVYLEGRQQTRMYQKDGTNVYRTELIADKMQMLGGKGEGKAPTYQAKQELDDDLPF